MNNFLYEIVKFVYNIFYNFIIATETYRADFPTEASKIALVPQTIGNFLQKQILTGTLIEIPITWRELILFIIPILLTIFVLIFFVKAVLKLLNFVRI